MTNSITDISKVRVQLLEWQVNTALVQYVQVWGNGCTNYLLTHYWEN